MEPHDVGKVLETLEALLELAPEARAAEARRRLADDPGALSEVLASLPFLTTELADDERFAALRPVRAEGLVGEVLGERYRLDELVARGGLGVIYAATDTKLDRRVAVKVLHAGFLASETARERFARECRSAASLEHENIARVYDSGAEEDLPYCVLELVPGGKSLAKHRCDPRGAARLTAAIARGLQHSHDAGVIHRDIKPGNVLLTEDGTPKVADFGLAQDERFAVDRLTRTGEVAGTPYYMSPEQVARRRAPITASTDIYSLGAVLYELLAQKPPHEGETSIEVFEKIRDEVPRRLGKDVPRDVATICFKALRKRPEDRYAAASDFADDLDRYLAGEPIHARPASLLERGRRVLHRPRTLRVGAALLLFAGLGGLAIAIEAKGDLEEQRRIQEEQDRRRLDRQWKHIEDLVNLLPDDPTPVPEDD